MILLPHFTTTWYPVAVKIWVVDSRGAFRAGNFMMHFV